MNNILPSNLSAYTVILLNSDFILLIGSSRLLFPYLAIPIDTHWFVYSRCFSNHQTYIGIYKQIQQHEPRGARFISTDPTLKTMIQNYNYPEKHVHYQQQYKHNEFIYESKHQRSGAEFVLLPNDEISNNSRVLREFRVTLQLIKGFANPLFIGP